MISPDWLYTDPIPSRFKGGISKPNGGVKLRQAYLSSAYGSGADAPPRDDWMMPTPSGPADAPPPAGGDGFVNEAGASAPSIAPSFPETPPEPAPIPNASVPAPKPQPIPNARAGSNSNWQSDVSSMGEVPPHDHTGEDPNTVNQIPPAGAQLSGQGTWLTQAESQVGRAYVWGGKDPKTGFDCSGYAAWVLKQQGRPYIGSSTMTMFPNTDPVSDPQPGDLVFYNMNSADPHMQHVAVYMGNGQIIQSGGMKDSINIGDVNQPVGSAPIFRRPKGAQPMAAGLPGGGRDQPGASAQQTQGAPQPAPPPSYPANSTPTEWFSYADHGNEVMKITWDNGQTTYHTMGQAADTPDGTVMQTGSMDTGAGAENPKVGAGQDESTDDTGDQTEWPIPSRDDWNVTPTGFPPTTTPAPPPPTRDDWNRQAPSTGSAALPVSPPSDGTPSSDQTEWPIPQPGSNSSPDTTTPSATNSTPSADQTEWSLPDPGKIIQGASQAVSGIAGGVARAASNLVASPGGPTPAASQPYPSDLLTHPNVEQDPAPANPVGTAADQFTKRLTPIQLAQPDQGRPLSGDQPVFQTPQDGQNAALGSAGPGGNVQLPTADPNADLTPVARETAGAPVNPFDVKNQLTNTLAEAVTPDDLPARDWFKTAVSSSIDPSMMLPGGVENEVGNAAVRTAGKGIAAAARGVRDAIPDAAQAAVDRLWDPATHTFQAAWERLMPDSLQTSQAAMGSAKFGLTAGMGALSATGYAVTHDQSDPNYWPTVIAAGAAGMAGAHIALNVTPYAVDLLKREFAPAMRLPAPVRKAITARANRLVASRGENWLWANRIEDALGKPGKGDNTLAFWRYVEENGAAPPNRSSQVKQLVDDLVKYTQDTRDEGARLGYINGDITTRPDARGVTLKAYMPRVLKSSIDEAGNAPGVWHGKLNPKDSYSYMRQNVSLADAEAAGKLDLYENAPSKAFGHYAEHVNASRANALFVKDLKKIAPGAVTRIKSVKNVSQIGNGDWVWGGQYARQWQNVAFSPELKDVLENMTRPGAQDPVWRGALNVMAEAKNALFAPSLFHLGNEVRQVFNAAGFKGLGILPKTAFYMIPGAGANAARKFWTNPSVMAEARDAMSAGLVLMRRMPDVDQAGIKGIKGAATRAGWGAVTGGAAGYMNSRFDSTLSDQDRIERGLQAAGIGAAGGLVGGQLSKMLWSDTVPYMKLMTWKLLESKYGKEAAATFVNSVYGGQNLESIARSRKMQDTLRTFVLAPDWQEGWMRQIGNSFMSGPVGDMNRAYWTRAAVTGAFMLEGLNVALNGHASNDNGPGHELTLETTGLYDKMGWGHTDTQTGENYRTYVDLLGPYRGMLNAPLNPGAFLSARQGLLPEELGTTVSGKDWRGKDIAPPGSDPLESVGLKAAYLLSRLAPVGPAEVVRTTSQSSNEPLGLQVGLSVAGLRETRQSPLQLAVQQRDQQYRDVGITTDQEQQLNTTYTGLLKEAERSTSAAFDPSKKHSDVVTAAQQVDWPTRQNLIQTLEPAEIAADPIKNADWITKIRGIQSIGTQSSEASADAAEDPNLDMHAVSDAYWNPPGKTPDQMARLPQDAQDRIRESALVQQALLHSVDPNAVRDKIKAQARNEQVQPLPGITSAQLDEWVNQYRAIQDPDVQVQAQKRRDFVDQTAQSVNQDPGAVYERIKLRTLPLVHEDPNEPGIPPDEKQRREMQVSFERAQDVLHNSKDPTKYPRYANPDGTAYKGSTPAQWDQWDQQVAADTKAGKRTHTPEVQTLLDAKDTANSTRLKALLKDPAGVDYERWYGVGRNMDETHWQQYVKGQGHQFLDVNDPTENRRRTRTLELWNASTPKDRQTTKVKIKVVVGGQVREEVTTLDQAKKHIERAADPAWKTDLGLDTTGTTP